MDKRVTGKCKRILDLTVLHITYKQKSAVISIICILAILVVWFLKKYRFYSDDLFFMGIILVIWVYAWRQNNTIAGFLSNLTAQSQDILLPIPGTDILSNQGLKAAPVTPSADTRSGILPEHYDYLPDDMKRVSKPAAFNPSAPIASSDELPQFNRMINLMEPTDHPVYKLTNEVLTALDNKCLAHDSTDTAKPMTEFMRQNGAGQSKWAFIEESEQQAVSAHNIPWSRNFNYTPHHTDNPEQTGGCNKNLDYAVPSTLNSKPTPGGQIIDVTSVPLHWANNPVHMVRPEEHIDMQAQLQLCQNKKEDDLELSVSGTQEPSKLLDSDALTKIIITLKDSGKTTRAIQHSLNKQGIKMKLVDIEKY